MWCYRWTALAAALLAATAAYGDVRISPKPTKNMNCTGGVCTATAKKAVLNVSDLAAMLAGGDVKVVSGSQAQDIEVDAAVSWASAHRLTLDAYRSIMFNSALDVTGTGALTITTNDGGTDGTFRFFGNGRVRMWDVTDSLVINAVPFVLVKNIKQLQKKEAGAAANVALVQGFDLGKQTASAPPIATVKGVLEGLGNTITRFKINSASAYASFVGLLASTGTIRDLRLGSVSITASGARLEIGALVGHNDGTIDGCFADGQVMSLQSGQTFSDIGGLVGTSDGLVVNSGAAVSVSSQGGVDNAGGLVGVLTGSAPGTVEVGYATGSVSATGAQSTVGGLVGANLGGFIVSSYARGAVTGGDQAVAGGLVGFNTQNADLQPQVIDEAYSTGEVTGGSDAFVGGVIGVDSSGFNNFDTYWDLDTSGISDPSQGAGSPQNDLGLTGLTTAQFLAKLPSGFAKATWRQGGAINDGYPYLLNNPPQ